MEFVYFISVTWIMSHVQMWHKYPDWNKSFIQNKLSNSAEEEEKLESHFSSVIPFESSKARKLTAEVKKGEAAFSSRLKTSHNELLKKVNFLTKEKQIFKQKVINKKQSFVCFSFLHRKINVGVASFVVTKMIWQNRI